jgi:membrane fusion protein, copper/silver efflux system
MNRKQTFVIAIFLATGLLAVGLFAGRWWARQEAGHGKDLAGTASTADAHKALYWYDPMMPDQHFDKPGKSPFMDMQLVPKYPDETAGGGVRIAADMRQNVGLRTAVVGTGTLASTLRVPGTLTWDLRQEAMVSARVEGIVTRVMVKAPFEPVRRGQALATLLAPEWSSALAEAQALGDARSASARELRSAAQERLRVLGVSGHGGRSGVALLAPSDGVVTEVLVREGQTVMPGMPLFRINGTATLWLEAAIPQASVAGIRSGTPVEVTIGAAPGQTFKGEVERLLPVVDALSRAQRARIVLRNPDGLLAPGMFAEVTLQAAAGVPVPLIPSEALIATGDDSRVIVQTATGAFRPVRVRTGRSSGGRTEILAGLSGGERVVVSGQFLIDSEASLSGALARMDEAPAPSAQAPMPMPMPMMEQDMRMQQEPRASPPKPSPAQRMPTPSPARDCTVAYWYDPMVPDKHFDQPGKSPFMEMQLVPKFAHGAASDCTIRDLKADAGEARS